MGKVFITGGSGALGQALVKKFVDSGWETAFSYCRNQEAAKRITEQTGAMAYQADLQDHGAVMAMAEELEKDFGVPDALINNAGRSSVMPFALLEPQDWDEAMNANLKTMFLASHALVSGMVRRRSGSVVNLSSIAGERLLGVPVTYATSKSGVLGFTLSLARELARYNIRVNAVAPGLLDAGISSLVPPEERKEYLRYCLAGRPGRCQEVAEVVEFLASDRASFVNAQIIDVNGGI
ncbi:MAG: SDR family oxidoreductase [Deltaproteobacteria bacterium]|jgi:3-oxoacyl-[acyl-carrier protein] reductase|nr:SDR family oxidoreductase [Deltaproteobacteria bacterium]